MRTTFWIGILLSLFFGYLAFRQIDMTQLFETFRAANYLFLILIAIVTVLELYIRAVRWKYLFQSIKPVGIHSLFAATSIGFMALMLFPARIGEFVRAYVIGEKEQVSKSASFATIVVERLLDGFSILFILVFLLLFAKLPQGHEAIIRTLRIGGFFTFLLYLVIIGFLFLLRKDAERASKIVQRLLFPLPYLFQERAGQVVVSFASGLGFVESWRHFLTIFLFSALLWLMAAFLNFLVILSFNLNVPFYGACLLLVLQALGVMLPSSPGFIGTHHAASVAGFIVFGVAKEEALGAAIAIHAFTFFPMVIVGMIYLWIENLSLRELKNMRSRSV